ncbi:MAG: chorismate mutase [Pseudonocardia sp.]|nr:chorismate mutase [Pseudonocardia sp.]MDT7614787.1 chorismate mutase [Pseudonocardiales bacterium]
MTVTTGEDASRDSSRDSTGVDDLPTENEIQALRAEINELDAEILRLVKRRSEVSQRVGRARMAAGGPRIVYNREMTVLKKFAELGADGHELGMILLRLGRGHLGRH